MMNLFAAHQEIERRRGEAMEWARVERLAREGRRSAKNVGPAPTAAAARRELRAS